MATNTTTLAQMPVHTPSMPKEEITLEPESGQDSSSSESSPHGMCLPPNSFTINAEKPYRAIDNQDSHLRAGLMVSYGM